MAEAMIHHSDQFSRSLHTLDHHHQDVPELHHHCHKPDSNPEVAAVSAAAAVATAAAAVATTNHHQQQHHQQQQQLKRVSHDTRTVIIEIPESKRQKISPRTALHQVLQELSTALSNDERREAIGSATAMFDHNDPSWHDQELELKADKLLLKHLGFLLAQQHIVYRGLSAPSAYKHELSVTCEGLEMVLRASPAVVAKSFANSGHDALGILVHLIHEELVALGVVLQKQVVSVSVAAASLPTTSTSASGSAAADGTTITTATETTTEGKLENDMEGQVQVETSPLSTSSTTPSHCPSISEETARREESIVLRKTTKILGHFARVGVATQPMAYFPGLLPNLIRILLVGPEVNIPLEAQLNSLWIMANLACNTENMAMMACQPHLLNALVASASRSVVPSHDPPQRIVAVYRSQSIAARALVNLSWAPENRIPMSEHRGLLASLAKLAVQRTAATSRKSRTLTDLMKQSRRHSINTLLNLATAPPMRCRRQLCYYENGIILEHLTNVVLNDDDIALREKAFSTIHHLAHQETAECLIRNPSIIMVLQTVLSNNSNSGNGNGNSDCVSSPAMKTEAAKTLAILEANVPPDRKDAFAALQELITAVKSSSSSSSSSIISSNAGADGSFTPSTTTATTTTTTTTLVAAAATAPVVVTPNMAGAFAASAPPPPVAHPTVQQQQQQQQSMVVDTSQRLISFTDEKGNEIATEAL